MARRLLRWSGTLLERKLLLNDEIKSFLHSWQHLRDCKVSFTKGFKPVCTLLLNIYENRWHSTTVRWRCGRTSGG